MDGTVVSSIFLSALSETRPGRPVSWRACARVTFGGETPRVRLGFILNSGDVKLFSR